MQATFDSQFNCSTFSTLLRTKSDVRESEQRRQSAIEEHNALMLISQGGLPEPIVNHYEEVESIDIPKTSVELLTEDYEMLRKGVEKMLGQLVSSTRAVKYDFVTHNAHETQTFIGSVGSPNLGSPVATQYLTDIHHLPLWHSNE